MTSKVVLPAVAILHLQVKLGKIMIFLEEIQEFSFIIEILEILNNQSPKMQLYTTCFFNLYGNSQENILIHSNQNESKAFNDFRTIIPLQKDITNLASTIKNQLIDLPIKLSHLLLKHMVSLNAISNWINHTAYYKTFCLNLKSNPALLWGLQISCFR